MWEEHNSSLEDRLVFFLLKKGKFQRIGNAFMRCLSFFFILHKEPMGISGRMVACARGQSRALTVWSAGSFGKGPIRRINITPDHQRKISVAGREVMILLVTFFGIRGLHKRLK